MTKRAFDKIAAGLTEAIEMAKGPMRSAGVMSARSIRARAEAYPTLVEMPVGAFLDPADMYRVLGQACAAAGGQKAWAERHCLSRQYVCDVLNARRQPSEAMLRALGLQLARRYVKMRTVNG